MILRILLSALILLGLSVILPGITIGSYLTAIFVAIVLAIVNYVIKPILIILTIPITVLTLGLFLLVINGLMVLLADWLVTGFDVKNLLWAIIFSLIYSAIHSVLIKSK